MTALIQGIHDLVNQAVASLPAPTPTPPAGSVLQTVASTSPATASGSPSSSVTTSTSGNGDPTTEWTSQATATVWAASIAAFLALLGLIAPFTPWSPAKKAADAAADSAKAANTAATQLNEWRKREETMRLLRSGAELAAKAATDWKASLVGIAMLESLKTAENLIQADDKDFIDRVVDAISKAVEDEMDDDDEPFIPEAYP